MNLTEKPVSQEYIYNGKIISLRVDQILLPNEKPAIREVIEHPGGVCVAAITESDEILLVRQFRYPYMEEILEIPAGKKERGEDPLTCGMRELKEETGATAKNFFSLGKLYPTPGYCGETIHLYGATELSFGDDNPDDDEFLECIKLPFEKVVQMIISGEIKDAKTQTAVLKLDAMRSRGLIK
ncbi:MAG: NUDIX hydrolase [Oscillospiraceae bacterium]|nr:NUDIX hydrolase [Oscillospiraceae bacterium]